MLFWQKGRPAALAEAATRHVTGKIVASPKSVGSESRRHRIVPPCFGTPAGRTQQQRSPERPVLSHLSDFLEF
jgi:hypothetical protein